LVGGWSSSSEKDTESENNKKNEEKIPVSYVNQISSLNPTRSQNEPNNPSASSAPPKRRFVKGIRGIEHVSFSNLNWITEQEDKEIIEKIIRVGCKCAKVEKNAIYDVQVFDDTNHDNHDDTTEAPCFLYRIVFSMSGNVPVNKKTLDTIDNCAPSRISSIGIVTVIENIDKHEVSVCESLDQLLKDKTTTQIAVFLNSINRIKISNAIEKSSLINAFRPAEENILPNRQREKKRKL